LAGGTPAPLLLRPLLALAALAVMAALSAAEPWSEWKRAQSLRVEQPGLHKFDLPLELLDATRPHLEDLRLLDAARREVPFLIDRALPSGGIARAAASFQVSLSATETVITLATDLPQPITGVTLETPAVSFIKAVKIEGSPDGQQWQVLAEGQPIFRQPGSAPRLQLPLAPAVWRWLRLTVDDQRSGPVPFSGAQVHQAGQPGRTEPVEINMTERTEDPEHTRLVLNLPAANLQIVSLEIETPERLFTRQAGVSVRQVADNQIREIALSRGTLSRVAAPGQAGSANLTLWLDAAVPTREMVLTVQNDDNPALQITGVRARRRPAQLVFLAQDAGEYRLLCGNPRCAAPRYDLANLGLDPAQASVAGVSSGPLADHSGYRPPEALAKIQETGTPLDTGPWKFRKRVQLSQLGVQQMELDLEVHAQAKPGLQDLRLVREGRQLPYVLEPTSISRRLTPAVTLANEPKKPRHSRWALTLPHPRLPVNRLTCVSRTALFQREVRLSEEVADDRGERHTRWLGQASWSQTPERPGRTLIASLTTPQTDTIYLEIDNRDNPPVELDQFEFFHPVTRLFFKAEPEGDLFLYYGHGVANAPQYDLGLIAPQVLAAEKVVATLGPAERLTPASWRETEAGSRTTRTIFWVVLGVVVLVLLVVLSRLLPKPSGPPPPQS
jgi:hypothetical protein